MTKFFTSDLHFQHVNLCKGVSNWPDKSRCRDFSNTDEMDAAILDSINNKVGPGDELYILGDFCFGNKTKIPSFVNRINCNNLHLIYGNHDDAIISNVDYQKLFASTQHYKEVKIHVDNRKMGLVLFHYCINGVWNKAGKGYCHLFGHSHGSFPVSCVRGKAFDVGWDVWGEPLSDREVMKHMDSLSDFEPIDHHTERTSYY